MKPNILLYVHFSLGYKLNTKWVTISFFQNLHIVEVIIPPQASLLYVKYSQVISSQIPHLTPLIISLNLT